MSLPTPTWTALDLAQAADRSIQWIRRIARREGLGRFAGNRHVYTATEAERILQIIREALPGRGRPRKTLRRDKQ